MKIKNSTLVILLLLATLSCTKEQPIEADPSRPLQNEIKNNILNTTNTYAWKKDDYQVADALINQITPPSGYKRISLAAGSFGDWLRFLPLQDKGSPVLLHDGGKKNNNVHSRVIDIDVGTRDLQQCADAVMRLKAEYHYTYRAYDKIHFNFTNGTPVSFDMWRKGIRPIVRGNAVTFTSPDGGENNSYRNFKKYLISIFSYAGTASLEAELERVPINDISIGDVFIEGGFPGHAVIVVDVAENTSGERIFLLAQSYMPAQSIHILKNPNNKQRSPWYSYKDGDQLFTPEWTFDWESLKRFPK